MEQIFKVGDRVRRIEQDYDKNLKVGMIVIVKEVKTNVKRKIRCKFEN